MFVVSYLRANVGQGSYIDALEYKVSNGSNRLACIRVSNEQTSGYYEIAVGPSTAANNAPSGLTVRRDKATGAVDVIVSGNLSVSGSISGANAFQTGDFCWSYRSSKSGWLLCNGATVSRTTYAALFAVIGTKFGAGDGSTTFSIPNLRSRVIQGANGNLGNYLNAGLPNISGKLSHIGNQNQTAGGTGSGAFSETGCVTGAYEGGGSKSYRDYNFNASRSSSIYGASSTVQPPALCLNCFIKY